MGMKKALIVVDMQHDFLPGGALGVEHGDKIVPEIVRLIESGKYGVIVTTQDLHPVKTKHFEKWPPHCVRGTPGAELVPEVAEAADEAREQGVPVYHLAKGQGTEDDGYSGFEGTTLDDRDLEGLLHEHDVERVDVVGLATDYCVKATAIDAALTGGFDTRVMLGATRPVADDTGAKAVIEMVEAGVALDRKCWNCGGSGVRCCEFAAAR